MRLATAVIAAMLFFSLPLMARAGEGCPHAKQSTASASVDASAGEAAKAASCEATCPHAEAMEKAAQGGCPCAGAAASVRAAEGDVEPSSAPQSVAATD